MGGKLSVRISPVNCIPICTVAGWEVGGNKGHDKKEGGGGGVPS